MLKEIGKKTITKIRLSTSLLQITLLPPVKSFTGGQAFLALIQKSLYNIYYSTVSYTDGFKAVE